jgi:hypothetical protein
MGGCDNCSAKAGCDDRKGPMFSAIDQALARLYPTRRWGEPDDLARFEAGVSSEDAQALAEELAYELDASTWYRPGEPEDYGDFIYVLCVGREPSLIQIREGEVPLPAELLEGVAPEGTAPEGTVIEEQYLRVCLSSMVRMAGVQQVAVTMERAGDALVIREAPRAGVFDAPFLRRFQRLVALLPAYDIAHLDFGDISTPAPGFDAGRYRELYGSEPHIANYLLLPQPSNTVTTTVLDVREAPRAAS